MRALANRVGRLETKWQAATAPGARFRLIVSALGKSLNLEASTCTRRLSSDGQLTELVHLEGSAEELTAEELNEFVERFPIQKDTV